MDRPDGTTKAPSDGVLRRRRAGQRLCQRPVPLSQQEELSSGPVQARSIPGQRLRHVRPGHPQRDGPPSEPLLYMSISNGELVHGKGGQMSEYIRPRMAADQPVWRKYVEEQAKKFYGEQQA